MLPTGRRWSRIGKPSCNAGCATPYGQQIRRRFVNCVRHSSGSEAQKALDRFVDTAHKKGKEKPGRHRACQSDRQRFRHMARANDVKGDLCAKPIPVAQKEPRVREREPSRARPMEQIGMSAKVDTR
jgi:hypothetical protein